MLEEKFISHLISNKISRVVLLQLFLNSGHMRSDSDFHEMLIHFLLLHRILFHERNGDSCSTSRAQQLENRCKRQTITI